VNALAIARYLGTRLHSAELTAAAWLDTRRHVRLFPLAWVHQGVRPWLPTGIAVAVLALGHPSRAAGAVITIVGVALTVFSRIAAKSHHILNEEDRPCPYCPKGEGPGNGGLWLDWDIDDDDIPPAPNELTEITDEEIRESLSNFDADYAEVCREATR